jgi:hypothetical protein
LESISIGETSAMGRGVEIILICIFCVVQRAIALDAQVHIRGLFGDRVFVVIIGTIFLIDLG